jgi:hypothetical protein
MRGRAGRNFLAGAAAFVMFAAMGWAVNHHELNGTWQLLPARSNLNGEPAIKSGTVTIHDREGNIYVSRNFDFDAAHSTFNGSFSTDAREGTAIKRAGLWSKSKWEGGALTVTTVQNGVTTVERYSLLNDGSMMEQVTRTGHQPETFYFERE